MDQQKIHIMIEDLNRRLEKLEILVVQILAELENVRDLGEKAVCRNTLSDTLLRLVRQWRGTILQAIEAPSSYHAERSDGYMQLDFALGQARGLGRDFDLDMSWSVSGDILRRRMSDVSMSALAVRSLLRGQELPVVAGMFYDDI